MIWLRALARRRRTWASLAAALAIGLGLAAWSARRHPRRAAPRPHLCLARLARASDRLIEVQIVRDLCGNHEGDEIWQIELADLRDLGGLSCKRDGGPRPFYALGDAGLGDGNLAIVDLHSPAAIALDARLVAAGVPIPGGYRRCLRFASQLASHPDWRVEVVGLEAMPNRERPGIERATASLSVADLRDLAALDCQDSRPGLTWRGFAVLAPGHGRQPRSIRGESSAGVALGPILDRALARRDALRYLQLGGTRITLDFYDLGDGRAAGQHRHARAVVTYDGTITPPPRAATTPLGYRSFVALADRALSLPPLRPRAEPALLVTIDRGADRIVRAIAADQLPSIESIVRLPP